MAFERGINFFDTANGYNHGDSERLLGRIFRNRRHQVILCSKAGHKFWASLPVERWISPLTNQVRRRLAHSPKTPQVVRHSSRNYAPRFIELAIAGSLRRLGTDYLDLFYLHNPPPEVVADSAVFEALERLRERGWIRYYGVSCSKHATSDEALACLQHSGISALQVLTNAHEMIDLGRIRARALDKRVALVGRQPFHKGAIFSHQRLHSILAAHPGRSPAQTALRFAMQLEGVDVVLVGMRTRKHLEENLATLSSPALSADEMGLLEVLAKKK
jgi:aryl-alcohol dehydrogenase-like predicted oxidoreductase